MFNDKELKFFDRHGKQRPEHSAHGYDSWESPISSNMKAMQCSNWRLEGNKLLCDTPNGPFTQLIPTDRIMTGIDGNGLPILQKIDIQ